MNIGELAGETMEFIMSKIDSQGSDFVDQTMQILTLCISELIKSGYCKQYYQEAIEMVISQIKGDFNPIAKQMAEVQE